MGIAGTDSQRTLPPPHLWGLAHTTDADAFAELTRQHLAGLRAHCGLSPRSRILDVGCAAGRIALYLMDYLGDHGSYDGFDVRVPCIAWAMTNITVRRPAFRFVRADVRNTLYNPRGRIDASEWTFPYPDDSFDLAVAYSLFTHLRPASRDRYLREIHRTLRPGGAFWLTFFLADPGKAEFARNDVAFHPLAGAEGVWVQQDDSPEAAIAFTAEDVLAKTATMGWDVKIHRATSGADAQDVIYGRRP